VLAELRALASPRIRARMEHFGVRVQNAYGIPTPELHHLARRIGKDHALAEELWATGNHEARTLAALIDEPAKVTARQMDRWAAGFGAWDVVDAVCCYSFAYAPPAWRKAAEWSRRRGEFQKRAAFSLMAYLAYKDRRASDARFVRLLGIIRREADDPRNFVKKAVNWALRNIGKRNIRLNRAAIRVASEIRKMDSPAARWVAAGALRELRSAAVQRRLTRAVRNKDWAMRGEPVRGE
jgi:3-methyladenine DNA glycosylase AlkD